jgi:hypothetical protein
MTGIAASVRLTRLHLASRRVPASLLALAVVAVALRTVLHWTPAGGRHAVMVPLSVATAAAAVVSVTVRSPIGEPERATGRWLPWLRLCSVLALAGLAYGALALGAVGGHLAIGSLALLRDLAGLTGIGLLTAAVLGAGLSWIGPLAYLFVGIYAVQQSWTTPWLWPARPAQDRGAALCAALIFAVGAAAITLRGAADATRD